MAGVEISRAYVGVAGADIRSVNARGMVSVARKDREIAAHDIKRALDAAQSAALPSDREILHAHAAGVRGRRAGRHRRSARHAGQPPRGDGAPGDRPGGALARRCSPASTAPASRSPRWSSSRSPTAEAVLTPDERDLGVLLVDIGAGTTGYALFADGEVQHSARAADRRRPLHQRPRDGAAHAVRRGRADQDQGGLLPARAWSQDEEGISVPAVAGGAAARGAASARSARSSSRAPRRCSSLVRERPGQERLGRRSCAAASC